MANLLRYAPPGVFYRGQRNDVLYKRLKQVVDSWEVDDSPEAELSRLVLRAYCLEEFEAGNGEIVTALGWDTDSFIPPLDDDDRRSLEGYELDLVALDELWEPKASPSEREEFYTDLAKKVKAVRRSERNPLGRNRRGRLGRRTGGKQAPERR